MSQERIELPELDLDHIYSAWKGAGIDLLGGDWKRFAGMVEPNYTATTVRRLIAEAVAAEREACAMAAESQIERWVDDRARYSASECAAAIRARGAKT